MFRILSSFLVELHVTIGIVCVAEYKNCIAWHGKLIHVVFITP